MAQTFFTVEIYYNGIDSTLNRYVLRNMTAAKLKEFREVIISAGLMMPANPEVDKPGFIGEYKIILPWNIKEITVYRQQKFFHDNQTKKDPVKPS